MSGDGHGVVSMPPFAGTQTPDPLHTVAAFSVGGGPKQAWAPHGLDEPGKVHANAFCPSQMAAQVSKPAVGQRGRFRCGVPKIVVHTPPPASHAWHCPLHAESQQVLSTQWLVSHSLSSVQVWP